MVYRLLKGSEIEYSFVNINDEDYQRAISDIDCDIHGFVVGGVFHPAEDISISCKSWCVEVTERYKDANGFWVILKSHPGDISGAMSDIRGQDYYRVVTYDVWSVEDIGAVAVITETDED